jgi:hypothetical protein
MDNMGRLFERWWIVIPLMALAVVLMLHASLQNGFDGGDDPIHIENSLTSQWSNFQAQQAISAMPLTRFSYRIDYYLFHPADQPRHLSDKVNISALESWAPAIRCMSGFYHLLAAVLLWLFLRRLNLPSGVACLVAVLWAAHPSACESVCWVSERKTVLAALFGFGALLAWTTPSRFLWRLPLACCLYILAHLCKPSALGLLPVMAALEFLNSDYQQLAWSSGRRWLLFFRRLAVPILISVGFVALSIHNHVRELVDPPGGNAFTALLTDVEIFGRYAINTLLPFGLSFYYGVRPITSAADVRLWLYLALEIGFVALLIIKTPRERRPLCIFGLIWFLSALGPHSNLVSTPYWMQDRYMYLAMPGLLIAVMLAVRGMLLTQTAEKSQDTKSSAVGDSKSTAEPVLKPPHLVGISAVYAVFVFALLIQRAALFCDGETLVLDAAMRQPLSSQAQIQYAEYLKRQFFEHLPEGRKPDPGLAKVAGLAASEKYAAAAECPDLVNFDNPFAMKVISASILLKLGEYEGVRRALDGWLPPPDLQMLKVKRFEGSALELQRRMYRGYFPWTLAHAWSLMAEASIAQSQARGLSQQDRLALLNRASGEAKKAMEAWDQEDESLIVTAKVLLFMAGAEPDRANAQTKFKQGMDLLKSLPSDTPHASVVRYWIEHPPAPLEN